MLHMLRTFRCSKLDASVSQRGYLHSRYRIFLKDRDGILADDALAWELQPDGTWVRVPEVHGINAHDTLQDLAVARSRVS